MTQTSSCPDTWPTLDAARTGLLGRFPQLRPLPHLPTGTGDGEQATLYLNPITATVFELRPAYGGDGASYMCFPMEAEEMLQRLSSTVEAVLIKVCDPSGYLPLGPVGDPARPSRTFVDDLAVIDEYNQIRLAQLHAEVARGRAGGEEDDPDDLDGEVYHAAAWELGAARVRVTRLEMMLALHLRTIRDAASGSGAPAELARRLDISETAVRDALAADVQWRMPIMGV
ncbi:hypothetical protein [Planomonospora sp. ID82291]|uniref:hypothetical protein n=1 Tax=Planomonospora sp. ID82291 TaxID=2738136 RepID=UPI0018C38C1C|nr:hypothetical protein [Planomonospora sp. ID82291]MBG0818358.1 hypothetical protein [Planomonospora sp. ID82291]